MATDKLPMLGIGKTWAVQLYPGGRRHLVQIEPSQIDKAFQAFKALQAGRTVYVWPSDADAIWRQYQDTQRKP